MSKTLIGSLLTGADEDEHGRRAGGFPTPTRTADAAAAGPAGARAAATGCALPPAGGTVDGPTSLLGVTTGVTTQPPVEFRRRSAAATAGAATTTTNTAAAVPVFAKNVSAPSISPCRA